MRTPKPPNENGKAAVEVPDDSAAGCKYCQPRVRIRLPPAQLHAGAEFETGNPESA